MKFGEKTLIQTIENYNLGVKNYRMKKRRKSIKNLTIRLENKTTRKGKSYS